MLVNFFAKLIIIVSGIGLVYLFIRQRVLVKKKELVLISKFRKVGGLMSKKSKDFWDQRKEQQLLKKISQNPGDIDLYKQLSALYKDQGDVEGAKDCWQHILKLDPENQEAKEKLE